MRLGAPADGGEHCAVTDHVPDCQFRVRVAETLAGANWGGSFVPRSGQEVLVAFLEGDIDRPVIIGAVYNGQGAQNAQTNQVGQTAGGATANAPAWFPGSQSAHAHNAVLAGLYWPCRPSSGTSKTMHYRNGVTDALSAQSVARSAMRT